MFSTIKISRGKTQQISLTVTLKRLHLNYSRAQQTDDNDDDDDDDDDDG